MNAKDTHHTDQTMAAFLQMGAGLAEMYKALREGGMQSSAATEIVAAYARGLGSAMGTVKP
jgi:hypothetical protein